MKIFVLASDSKYALNFRGDLMHRMVMDGHEVYAVVLDRKFEPELNALGIKLVDISFGRTNINPFGDISLVFKYMKLFKKEKPDKIFSYTSKPVLYGSIAAGLCGIKDVYSLVPGMGYVFGRSGIFARLLGLIVCALYFFAFACCKKVFFQNDDDIEYFTHRKIIKKEKCVKINGSGVNLARFAVCDVPNRISFIMASRLLRSKGVGEYLKAAEIVKRHHPDVVFRLIGGFDANPDSMVREDIQPYIDTNTIEYCGEVDDVRPYLKDSSVLVLPTYYNEGLPRSILEALAMGRPVITTAWKGGAEAVIDGKTGFLVPIKDIRELAKKMNWLVTHPSAVKAMGQAGVDSAIQKYDVNKVNDNILEAMGLHKSRDEEEIPLLPAMGTDVVVEFPHVIEAAEEREIAL